MSSIGYYFKYYRVPENSAWREKRKGRPEMALPYRKSRREFRPYAKGGAVKCIYEGFGVKFEGISICSMSDNFDYKVGRAIAKGRCEKKIEEYLKS